jgi:hypothetical protein
LPNIAEPGAKATLSSERQYNAFKYKTPNTYAGGAQSIKIMQCGAGSVNHPAGDFFG